MNGVIGASRVPSAVALATPPTMPSTVFDGESRGAILRRPASFPQMYWKHVARLDDDDEVQQQERVAAFVARNFKKEQRRRVRDADDADARIPAAISLGRGAPRVPQS